MKKLNQILNEILDKPPDITQYDNDPDYKAYTFKVNHEGKNNYYKAEFSHLPDENTGRNTHAIIGFSRDMNNGSETIDRLGDMGHNAHKVFSGVHAAIRQHIKDNPHIEHYHLSAYEEGGRFGLATQHLRGFGSEEEYGEY